MVSNTRPNPSTATVPVTRRQPIFPSMGRREERIFRLNDEIRAIRRDEELAAEELIMLQHLDDDAQRDAAVSENPMDRADARETAGDVARMQAHIADLTAARRKREAKRDRLLARLKR